MAKIYSKNTWTDEVLADTEKYQVKDDLGEVVYSDAEISLSTGVVTPGSNVDAAKMNNIENGVDGLDDLVVGMLANVPHTSTAENDFMAGDGAGKWAKKTLAQTKTILNVDSIGGLSVNVEALSTGKTLANTDKYYQFLDPGGANRTITLPATGSGNHPFFIINTADADEILTIQNSSSVSIGFIQRGKMRMVVSDGSSWAVVDPSTSVIRMVTSDFSKTSDTTLATITGLTANVVAGGLYKVRVFLNMVSNASGGTKIAMSGTCTVSDMRLRLIRFGDVATTYGNISALDSASGETVVHRALLLEGYVLINAAGTLLVQGAQNASNASPTTFYTGSSMELERIF
jgi:hypothetical protein